MPSLRELVKTSLELYPPFIGLVCWKYRVAASALYHSLSVSTIASSIAELLTEDLDEIDIATYSGLIHDYYQKCSSVGLTAERSGEIIKMVLEEEGVRSNTINEVLESANYNIAENPRIWAGKHPIASLSIWLADTIAGATSAFTVQNNVIERLNRLGESQLKAFNSLNIGVISITIPQVALRSYMYSLAVKKLMEKYEEAVPIVARDGLVVIARDVEEPLTVDISVDEIRLEEEVINAIRGSLKAKEKTFNERFKPCKFTKGSSEKLVLDESVKSLLLNLSLLDISYEITSLYKCIFCGLPTPDPIHPASVGYVLYGRSSMERWNPKMPAIGVNLNRLMQQRRWLKEGIVACPLCVLDAITIRRDMAQTGIRAADYFLQLYFPLPTHYILAAYLSSIAFSIKTREVSLEDVISAATSPAKYAEFVVSLGQKEVMPLIDSTWAMNITTVRAEGGDEETFASLLPCLARIILFTGVYPIKLSRKPDPSIENKLIIPVHPLYDYELTKLRSQTPLNDDF